jgi:hypothetical protein
VSLRKALITIAVAWLVTITLLHGVLNLHLFARETKGSAAAAKFGVGFIPVTCHLSCPVTDFINKNMEGDNFFQPMRFNGFPELKETFLGKPEVIPATFILAPMAMALREQSVPIKIVYLGHRDGTAMMVHKDSKIQDETDETDHDHTGDDQVVAFPSVARALAANPDIIYMNEPFGALDFLTRMKMRADLVRIWQSEKKTILFVTHDIEEAVQLADRILVMTKRPATIQEIVDVDLARPRDLDSRGYLEKRDRIFRLMGMSLRVGEAAA